MLSFISNFFKNKQMIMVSLGAIIIILFGLLFHIYERKNEIKREKEQQEKRFENNIKALNDKVKKKENKIGEKTSYIRSLKLTKGELKNLNDSLFNVVSNQRGDIQSLIETNAELRLENDSLKSKNTVTKLDSNYYGLNFYINYREKGLKVGVKGISRFYLENQKVSPDSTIINNLTTSFDLKTGFREYKDRYEVFATPVNNNVHIKELRGVQIIEKEKSNNKNDILNVSLGATTGYNPFTKKFGFLIGPSIGIKIFGM